jgi:hypothetical protein
MNMCGEDHGDRSIQNDGHGNMAGGEASRARHGSQVRHIGTGSADCVGNRQEKGQFCRYDNGKPKDLAPVPPNCQDDPRY